MARDFIPEIRKEVREILKKHPDLSPSKAFGFWYVRSFLWPTSWEGTYDEDRIKRCIYCQPGEKNVDSIYEDDDLQKVFLIQNKFRQKNGNEPRKPIKDFCRIPYYLLKTEDYEFNDFLKDAAPQIKNVFRSVRALLFDKDYELVLHYVTTANVNKDFAREKRKELEDIADFEVVAKSDLNKMYEDYVEVGQPPIPSLEFPVDRGPISWKDPTVGLDSWLFAMNGSALADLYKKVGRRLFARNVRGYLGESKPVNRNIKNTAENEPEKFWYLNNGVTVVCSRASKRGTAEKTNIKVKDAQIINGQQTVRVLSEANKLTDTEDDTLVLVKLFVIDPEGAEERTRYLRELIDDIVEGTNTQSAVDYVDLMSNDYRQIRLQRELRKLHYNYVRKKGLKEARVPGPAIKKDYLALAVASAKLNPAIPPRGKQELFAVHYEKLFNAKYPIRFFITVNYLYKFIEEVSRKYNNKDPEKVLGKYLIMHCIWSRVNKDFARDNWLLGMSFVDNYLDGGVNGRNLTPLKTVTKRFFNSVKAFYRDTISKEEKRVKPSGFYRRYNIYEKFDSFYDKFERKYKRVSKTPKVLERFLGRLLG